MLSTEIHFSSKGSFILRAILQGAYKSIINTSQRLPNPALITGCSHSAISSRLFVCLDISMILALMKPASWSVRPLPRSSPLSYFKGKAQTKKRQTINSINFSIVITHDQNILIIYLIRFEYKMIN